jgi:MurNAc alpha-1-phosphate uridylyltransferase
VIAMLLAAGRGERLRPLTDSLPKALVEVHGVSLLERHLSALKSAGVETVVVNLGWHGEKIVERIGSGSAFGLNVVYSPEGESILETGGGIQRALPMLGTDPFLVINADIFTDIPPPIEAVDANDLAHLVLVPTPSDKDNGDFDLTAGRVRNGNLAEYTFSGVAVYRPEFFAGCSPGRFSVAPMLRSAADADRLGGSVYAGLWRDVGTPERLTELNK